MGYSGEENRNRILELIYKDGKVETSKLSKELNVSTESVRRYLESLEKLGKIKRVYGGAIKLNSYSSEEDINERYLKNEREKFKIAKVAAEYVKDGDRIIIDEGTTTYQMLEFLVNKKNLTIITSSFPLAIGIMNLVNSSKLDCELVFIGGVVQSGNKRTVGGDAVNMLSNYYADKAFISCEGISIEHGITAFDTSKAELTRNYLKHSKESIVMCDYTKIGIRNYYKIDEIFKINKIITNKDIPHEWDIVLKKWDIEWVKAL